MDCSVVSIVGATEAVGVVALVDMLVEAGPSHFWLNIAGYAKETNTKNMVGKVKLNIYV